MHRQKLGEPQLKFCRPLIKWPGGKRNLVPVLRDLLPERFGTYFEPFFGGGALFFALNPGRAVLGDSNSELINLYSQVRNYPNRLITLVEALENSEETYYKVRSSAPTSAPGRAARLLYLTRLSFNGIHRVNLKGEFNVPYGQKTSLSTVDSLQLQVASAALKKAKLLCGDFEDTTRTARRGDLVYFDPPYTVAHGLNGFIKYNENIFSWEDQKRLAAHAKLLAEKGCHVLVSNADHESIHALYRGFSCHVVERFSLIAASGKHRRRVTECVFSIR